jgi:ubiquinol-cytochrome c reductase cytochrome b subunit
VTGCLILLITLGFCFTGHLLPWSQLSYWSTTIGMNIVGSAPLAGPLIQRLLQGGEAIGADTLGRMFAIHTSLLPTTLVALIFVHLYLVRRTGLASPLPRRDGRSERGTRPLAPVVLLELSGVCLLVLGVFSLVLFFFPHLYFTPEVSLKADPFDTPPHVKPEWYFLPMYASLALIPSSALGMLAQGVAIAALVLLPFLDRGEPRHILERPLFLAGVCTAVAGLVGLAVAGALM